MNTLRVTCPADGAQFVVVEPEDHDRYDSLTVSCPECGEGFAIVYPDELRDAEDSQKTQTYEPYLGDILDWEQDEDPPAPYTGSDQEIPYEQYITAKINGLGEVPGIEEGTEAYREALGPDRFQIWYTPDHEEIAYVVRGDLETGVKTKNVYSHAGTLYVKSRGFPRDSDKQWTFLDRNECVARAVQAGLSGEITEDAEQEGRYNIHLDEPEQELVSEENELADELVLKLARVLVAFQTKRIR